MAHSKIPPSLLFWLCFFEDTGALFSNLLPTFSMLALTQWVGFHKRGHIPTWKRFAMALQLIFVFEIIQESILFLVFELVAFLVC